MGPIVQTHYWPHQAHLVQDIYHLTYLLVAEVNNVLQRILECLLLLTKLSIFLLYLWNCPDKKNLNK